MKLGVIEIDHHLECLHSLCAILEESEIAVTIFTTQKLVNELQRFSYYKKFDWQLASGKISSFLKNKLDILEKQDLLFFSTAESEFKTFNKLRINVPYLVRIHNANTFLERKKSWALRFSPYWLFKDASYLIRKLMLENEMIARNQFLKNASFLCFTSQEITQFVRNNQNYKFQEKIVDAVPITFNYIAPKPINAINTLAVIGTIDKKRKDYPLLLKTIKNVKQKTEKHFELKLMGKPKGAFGRKITREFLEITGENVMIKTWPNGLVQTDFDKEMEGVDLILAPIFSETKNFLIKELYGKTKISGSINDCIKYGKPGIVPSFYPLPLNVDSVFYTYKDEAQLEQMLLDILDKNMAPKISPDQLSPYSLENISQKVIGQLQELTR